MTKTYKISLLALALAFTVSIITPLLFTNRAGAISGSDWKAGRIIDDAIFYNISSMTPEQIQLFLEAKVPVCDRYRASSNPTYQPPWTCLKEYQENTITMENNIGRFNPDGSPYQVQGGKAASRIIWEASQKYGINPQVLIIVLQKEQSLVTDNWPWKIQYDRAMGYACPDSGPGGTANCDSNYYGFYNQVDAAAWQLKRYIQFPDNYNFKAGVTRYIQYSPSVACGGSNVFIENAATAALYNFTPYQPNAGALANLYGTADCGAYGNRNFWRMFNEWFGSTLGGDLYSYSIKINSPIVTTPANPVAGQVVQATYTIQNISNQSQTISSTVLQCRVASSFNCDSNWGEQTSIAPGESRVINQQFTATQGGDYTLVPFLKQNNKWYRYLTGNSATSSISKLIPNVTLKQSLTAKPSNPSAGSPFTVTINIRNNSLNSLAFDGHILQCRYGISSANCDSAYGNSFSMNPYTEKSITYTINPANGDDYTLTAYYKINGIWYRYIYTGTTIDSFTFNIPDLRLETPMSFTPADPIPGQPVTVNYRVKNYGNKPAIYQTSVLQCRLNNSVNCDPSWNGPITINPGEERDFSNTFNTSAGTYRFVPYFMQNNKWYTYNKGLAPANYANLVVPAYVADLRLETPMSFTPADPIPGQPVTVNYRVKNYGNKPAIYQTSVLQCRLNNSVNCDPSWNGPITINPGEERDFSNTFNTSAGTYRFVPYFMQNNKWYTYNKGLAPANYANLVVD